ncbi:UNVERIFIED_CONTAM: hypothetical protein HDU68_009881 [Siphonaria sp. JEL0065]|nr:hypothetical protein HDU68_009881 [Siphonaria sp. JEL0065]
MTQTTDLNLLRQPIAITVSSPLNSPVSATCGSDVSFLFVSGVEEDDESSSGSNLEDGRFLTFRRESAPCGRKTSNAVIPEEATNCTMPTAHEQRKKKSNGSFPVVFVAPRKLLAAEVAELHSPSEWEDAFPKKPLDTSPLTTDMTTPVTSSIGTGLHPMSDDEETPNLFARKTLPRIRPRSQRYTFKIGNQEHTNFSDAIADLMSKTTSDMDMVGMERIRVKTPVDRSLMLDTNGGGWGIGGGDEDVSSSEDHRSSSETLAKGIMIPNLQRSMSEGGPRYFTHSARFGSGGSVSDASAGLFSPVNSSGGLEVYGSSSSSIASNGSVKKGRFEVRPLD